MLQVVEAALQYCVYNELWSAVDFRAATEHFSQSKVESVLATSVGPPAMPAHYKIKPVSKNILDYVDVVYGGGKP